LGSHRFILDGHPDFELGIPRKRPITVNLETPQSDIADGLVFLVPGMGSERQEEYSAMLRRYISAKHNLVVVSVDAHCNVCRPHRSEGVDSVVMNIQSESIYEALGRFIGNGAHVDRALTNLNDMLALLISAKSETFDFNAIIEPPDGDYQNFGVLAALDHLTVLNELLDSDFAYDHENIICLGSSHGGYLAHLIHKFAPNTISGVIDASAYTETMPKFIDGKYNEAHEIEGNIRYRCSTKTHWQFNRPDEKTFFGADRAAIRDVGDLAHLEQVANLANRKCQFRMVHSSFDKLSPPELKLRQAGILASLGYDVQLDMIGEADIDGKFIKSLGHGMGISLELLFDKYYPTFEKRSGKIDREIGTTLCFEGPKYAYRIEHRPNSIYLDTVCEELIIGSAKSGSRKSRDRLAG